MPQWEAAAIDPVSKFVVSPVQGRHDETLIRRLLEDAVERLAYRPSRQETRGRVPDLRTLAQVQRVKHREGQRVLAVDSRDAHGSQRCVQQELDQLGDTTPNTSAIERRMNAHQVRRSLAFARRDDTKVALGWWGLTIYNGCRPHRSLRPPLAEYEGKNRELELRFHLEVY
jgi:hypothetical protein